MPFVSARYIEMINDEGQMATDTYVYATTDVGRVELMRVDAIDVDWQRYLAEGGVVSPFEIPTLSGIDPATAVVGDADLTMTATGTGFTTDSRINFNGGDEPTEFLSETQLTTIVKPSTAWHEGATVPVLVRTGEWKSAAYDFTFTPAARGADDADEE